MTAFAGNFPERRLVHITVTLLEILGAAGAVASIVSLALYLRDRKRK